MVEERRLRKLLDVGFLAELFIVIGGILIAFALESIMSVFKFSLGERIIIFGGMGFLLALSGRSFKEKDYVFGILLLWVNIVFTLLLTLLYTSY